MFRNILLYTVLSFLRSTRTSAGGLLVNTTSGYYNGIAMHVDGQTVHAFLNITYGQHPVGDLRFRPPRMAPYRPTVMPADRPAQPCYQNVDETYPGFRGTEMWNPKDVMTDHCLTLNIWSPAGVSNGAVLVWIFGGGFYSGSPSLELYNGSYAAAHSGIIVVAINYRLGPFGFLYLDDDEAPPNVGLLDQRLALQWLQLNLKQFGGNPAKVTLMGESAGGASVTAHLYAPQSWPLFNQAIVSSGTITSPWATLPKAMLRQYSIELANRLGCSGREKEILKCLRGLPSAAIQNEAQEMWTGTFMHFYFVPTVEDELFFGEAGSDNVRRGATKNATAIFGFNQNEGSYWLPTCLPQYFSNTGDGDINGTQMDALMPVAFPFLTNEQRAKLADHYVHATGSFRDALSAMVGDYYFTCNLLDVVQRMADNNQSTLFLFHFNHRSSMNPWPQWMGVMHGYEMEFIFGGPLKYINESYSFRDKEISRNMLDYWNSFVRYGVPIIRSPGAVRWKPYTKSDPSYLSFSTEENVLRTQMPHEGCVLFKEALSNTRSDHDLPSPALAAYRPSRTMTLLLLIGALSSCTLLLARSPVVFAGNGATQ